MKKRTYDVWEAIVANSGLPADMSPHDCRLSRVNRIEKLLPEVSPTTLKEHVGHASGSSVTEVNYTRPLSPAQDILRSGIERLATPVAQKAREVGVIPPQSLRMLFSRSQDCRPCMGNNLISSPD